MFTYSDEGLAAFKSYLAEIRKSLPVHMLVDAVEEDYRFEACRTAPAATAAPW